MLSPKRKQPCILPPIFEKQNETKRSKVQFEVVLPAADVSTSLLFPVIFLSLVSSPFCFLSQCRGLRASRKVDTNVFGMSPSLFMLESKMSSRRLRFEPFFSSAGPPLSLVLAQIIWPGVKSRLSMFSPSVFTHPLWCCDRTKKGGTFLVFSLSQTKQETGGFIRKANQKHTCPSPTAPSALRTGERGKEREGNVWVSENIQSEAKQKATKQESHNKEELKC